MAFKISDIPLVDTSADVPTVNDSLTVGETPPLTIPQSNAPPAAMMDTFGASPWINEDKDFNQALTDWHRSGQEALDNAVFDPDKAFKGMNLDFEADPETAKRTLVNESWMELNHDEPLAPTELQRAVQMQVASLAKFNEMASTPEELFTLIKKDATKRKDSKDMGQSLMMEAAKKAFTAGVDLSGSEGKAEQRSFYRWKQEAKTKPGYDPTLDGDYFEAWHEVQGQVKRNVDRFRPQLDAVFSAFQNEENYGAAARQAWQSLPEDQRKPFMAAMKVRATELAQKDQDGFFINFFKRTGRDIGGGLNDAMVAVGSHTADQPLPPLSTAGIPVGGLPAGDYLDAAAEQAKNKKEFRNQENFVNELVTLQQETYDPIRYLTDDGSWAQRAEKIAYGTPGVFFTAAEALYAPPVLAAQLTESHYQSMRQRLIESGKTEAEADSSASLLSVPAAAVEYFSERLGAQLLLGKLPFLEKALGGAIDKLGSGVARFGARAVAGTIEGGGQEIAQNYIDPLVQQIGGALGMDLPGVKWLGAGGEFDGDFSDNLDSFLAVAPLVIFGAAGGAMRDQRAKAFAAARTTELQAMGITAEGIAAINGAKGVGSLNIAVDMAMETRDPKSVEAGLAVEQLKKEAADTQAAIARLRGSYLIPRIVQTAEGYAVYDAQTGELINTAPDSLGAQRIASIHSEAFANQSADELAYIMSMVEAGGETLAMDPQAKARNSFETSTLYTALVAAAESPESIDKFHQQAQDLETLNGGNNGVTLVALGRNVSELRDTVRSYTNRLFQGSSVLTLVHETGHGMYQRARAAGVITREETLAFVRAVNAVSQGKLRSGESKALIEDGVLDADITEDMLEERVQWILEAELLRTRKQATADKPLAVSSGVISRNLLSLSKMLGPQTMGKFRALIAGARGVLGLASARALAMQKAFREGTLDMENHDAFLDKLTGRNHQADYEASAQAQGVEILGESDPFSLGRLDRPLFSASNVHDLRHDKTAWLDDGADPEQAKEIVSKYYKTAAFAGIPRDAVLLPMPSTSGRNVLPDAFAERLSKDFGNPVEKRAVGFATAKGEAKNKRTFFDKEADPVEFVPDETVIADLQGKKVFIVEDVHNTGESWIAFARMLKANGIEVSGIAALVSTEQRITTPRDIERLSEKVAAHLDKGIDEVLPAMQSLFNGTFKQLFNKAEADITRSGDKAAKLLEIAASGRRSGAYSNPLGSGQEGQGGILGDGGLDQGTFQFSLGRYSTFNLRTEAPTRYVKSSTGVLYPDGHEIRTNAQAPDPSTSEGLWNRLLDDGGRTRLPSGREAVATVAGNGIIDQISRSAESADRRTPFWEWLRGTLNSQDFKGIDPVEVLDALADHMALAPSVSETSNPDNQLHYLPLNDAGALLVADNASGEFSFGKLPTTDEVNEAQAFHEETPDQFPVFSLGSSRMLENLNSNAITRIQSPAVRHEAMAKLSRKLEDLRLSAERLELMAGVKRLKKSIRTEAKRIEETRLNELMVKIHDDFQSVLTDEDLVRIKAQPGHELLAVTKKDGTLDHLHGRLMSLAAAVKKHPDLFQLHRPGDYDGADGVSRTVFGGNLMPDQAAEELFAAHLISEPTPDALWALLLKEQASVAGMKEQAQKAKDRMREARQTAKQEANDWLASQVDHQEANFSDKQEILRTLSVLDGILSIVPAEIRGRVGGYTQLAQLGSNETRLVFLQDKLGRVDKEIERWLKSQYDKEFRALLDKARPAVMEPGEKPKGKISATLHDLFKAVEASMRWSAAEVEAHAVSLESMAASGDYTPEEENHMTLEANLVRLAGDWGNASAAQREMALREATSVYNAGYFARQREISAKREETKKRRASLKKATGKAGTEKGRKAMEEYSNTRMGATKNFFLSLLGWEQIVGHAFGDTTDEAIRLVDLEREAANRKADALHQTWTGIEELFIQLAGGRGRFEKSLAQASLKGQQIRDRLSGRKQDVDKDGNPVPRTKGILGTNGVYYSEMEAIAATLIWMQEDGQRHMLGHQDENGNYNGEWHYDQDFVDALEDGLSEEGKAVRLHLMEHYAGEYDRLNPIYKELNGINLPRHKFYSPLTVVPVRSNNGNDDIDPVTGAAMTGSGFTPGSLKTRGESIAQPDFRDALATFERHVMQMEHWMAYAKVSSEANQVLNNRDLKQAVEEKAGTETVKLLGDWVTLFAAGGTRDAAAHLTSTQMVSQALNRAAAAALVGRASVLAVQSVQLGAALNAMPVGSYVNRLAKLTTGNLGWGDALGTDYIQRRLKDMPPLVRQALAGLKSGTPSQLKHQAARIGSLIGGADALFTAGTYAMIYDYNLKVIAKAQGLTGQEAIDFAHGEAERQTERVAQPTRTGTRSYFENVSSSPAMKLAWAFASEPRQKIAMWGYNLSRKDLSVQQKARTTFVVFGVGGVLVNILRAAVRDMRDGGDDDEIFDERNWNLTLLALQSLASPLQGIPFVGDALQAIGAKTLGEYVPEGNLFSAPGKAADALTKIHGHYEAGETARVLRDVEDILTALSLGSDSATAATNLMHMIRDIYGIAGNTANLLK